MYLTIIIPVFNEQGHILKVLDNLSKVQMPTFVKEVETIIVDDHSVDNSYKLIQQYVKNRKNHILLSHNKNQGKGSAIRTAISNCRGNVILIQDADLELSPTDIPFLLDALFRLNVDLVNGSRYLHGILRPVSSYRRYLANKVFTLLTSILLNAKLTDIACGYKLFKKDLIKQFHLKENGFGFEAELLIKALQVRKNNVVEVPVHYFPRNLGEGKKIRLLDGFRVLITILKYGIFYRK